MLCLKCYGFLGNVQNNSFEVYEKEFIRPFPPSPPYWLCPGGGYGGGVAVHGESAGTWLLTISLENGEEYEGEFVL